MSNSNTLSISGPPTQKRFWMVVRSDNGSIFQYPGSNTTKISSHQEAQQYAQDMAAQYRTAVTVMESVEAIAPKHELDVVKIIDG